MEAIPVTYRNSGYNYTLVDNKTLPNGNIAAIYKQNELRDTYEVIILRWTKETTAFNKTFKARWRVPTDREWGTYGWTTQGLTRTKERYEAIN
jgi:hypothetical protein